MKDFNHIKNNTRFISKNKTLNQKKHILNIQDNFSIITDDDLSQLSFNHPIIHIDHGIGRYQGLATIKTDSIESDYLIILYAEKNKLYVPISCLNLVFSFIGISQDNIPLHKLGSDNWKKEKNKIKKNIYDHAVKLLDIYSHRSLKQGFSFKKNKDQYYIFCNDCPFEITEDQKKVIKSVLNDMNCLRPMDRLVCGDVGFGKTEVAMRAAFLSVSNFKQVAILVPTTLLAQQHFNNFKKRFVNWNFTIEILSRFRTQKEQDLIFKNTKIGKVNILIGTHKILLKHVKWNNLGLLIIDEEHRFGVHHKEIIKKKYSNIDILTLTATPIPRTLNMAITGIKDLSIIANPPSKRLAIQTFIQEYNSKLVRKAILREISRGGQVYYIYNKVKNINNVAQKLSILVPEARIKIGHGQMNNIELKQIMNRFYKNDFDVLVCTTIIESGIDIPGANTIIIENADHFGLSQLHQLRGRVGRSNKQSYAWLFINSFKYITSEARKRLDAFSSIDSFSAGFSLSNRDLEIRGVGELLGKEQSGHINNIGFSLYMKILHNAINSLKNSQNLSLKELIEKQPDIELYIPCLLPDRYIPSVNLRLYFYKKISSIKNIKELEKIKYELNYKFGKLPELTQNLIKISNVRLLARELGISCIKSNNNGGFFKFHKNNLINSVYLIKILKKEPDLWKMENSLKLKFKHFFNDDQLRLKWMIELLYSLKENIVYKT